MGSKINEVRTLSMDVVAMDGTVLRLTVHRTDAGHVELGNLLEITELREGETCPMTALSVESFLSATDSLGRLTLVDPMPPITIDRPMMVTASDWLQWLAETLTDADRTVAG